jgi:cell division protein FtsZ
LLEEASIQGAKGVLINITGGSDLTLFEVNAAATIIREAADEDANIIFGAVIDEAMRDQMRITVIATGFDREAVSVAAAGSTSSIPATAPRTLPRPLDDLPRPMMSARVDDLDVPTFIRKKAD